MTRRVFKHLGWREIDGEWMYLHAGGAITALPGYAEGHFAVQEEGAQLVALALGVQPGVAFARVPRRREALCGIRARAAAARPLGAVKRKAKVTQRR